MQGELFKMGGAATQEIPNITKPSWLDSFRVTLRIDHLMIAGILALVLYVLIFSFGVEKGKRYATAKIRAEQARQEAQRELLAAPENSPSISQTTGSAGSTPPAVLPVTAVTIEPPKAVAGEAALNGQYTIQVITFTNEQRAEQEVGRLKKSGYRAFIIPRGKYFQVCADAFQTVSEAKQKMSQLKQQGFAPSDAYIRPLNGLMPV
jgi:hypothetical protein